MAGPRKKAPAGPVPVESTRHADTRVNIPTGELADFVADAEKQPGAALYPRDPTLDPQLVWRGKDDQDLAEHLRVASVPRASRWRLRSAGSAGCGSCSGA